MFVHNIITFISPLIVAISSLIVSLTMLLGNFYRIGSKTLKCRWVKSSKS